MGERIMVSNNTIMARSMAISRVVTFTRLVGPVRVPNFGGGFLGTKGSFTGPDGTQLALLGPHHEAYHI